MGIATPIGVHPHLNKDYFWCIDPLDGTLPFIEGLTGYAVSVALVARNGKPLLSAIFLPETMTSYQTKIDV
jgi:3'-phosphoadenosine 5'-phosphosulfate (PAPS) 3'-phosphatase